MSHLDVWYFHLWSLRVEGSQRDNQVVNNTYKIVEDILTLNEKKEKA